MQNGCGRCELDDVDDIYKTQALNSCKIGWVIDNYSHMLYANPERRLLQWIGRSTRPSVSTMLIKYPLQWTNFRQQYHIYSEISFKKFAHLSGVKTTVVFCADLDQHCYSSTRCVAGWSGKIRPRQGSNMPCCIDCFTVNSVTALQVVWQGDEVNQGLDMVMHQ